MGLGLSFTNQIRLYRSTLALAREVRLRFGSGLFEAGNQTLAALLATVCERASELGLDPELPLPDAILVQRLAVQLSRASRLAEAPEPAEQTFHAHHPMQRETEEPDDRLTSKVKAMNRRDREEREAAERAAAE